MTKGHVKPILFIAVCLTFPVVTGLASEEVCPFAGFNGPILAAASFSSWDEYGNLYGGTNVGDVIIKSIQKDVLPSILRIAEATGTLADLPRYWDQLASATNWDRLKKTRVAFALFEGIDHFPKVALRFTPPEGETVPLYQDIAAIFAGIAGQATDVLTWQDNGTDGFLSTSASDNIASPTGNDPIHLFSLAYRENHVFLESVPDIKVEKDSESTLCDAESFRELWKHLPQSLVSSIYLDFEHIFGLLETTVDGILDGLNASRPASSFVLDATNEALFKDDLETLEKLRQVENDFNTLMPDLNPDRFRPPLKRLLTLAKAQGQFLIGTSQDENSILSTTLWRPGGDPVGVALFATDPLSPVFLGLLQSECVESSLASMPDFRNLYSTLVDIIRQFPQGDTILEEWNQVQKSVNLSFEKDILAAIGNESAWISTPRQKPSFSGLQVISNDVTLLLRIDDRDAAQRTLIAFEKVLAEYGLATTQKPFDQSHMTELDMSLFGKVSWTLLPEPAVFLLTTSASEEYIHSVVTRLKQPQPIPPTNHPDWPVLKKIWVEHPTAVSMTDLSATWKQTIDQLRSSQMMLALMGPVGSTALPFLQLGLKIMTTVKAPESMFTVAWNENGLRIHRTLLVYPDESTP